MTKANTTPIVIDTTPERRKRIDKAVKTIKEKTGRGSMRIFIEDAIDEKLARDEK